MRNLRLGIIGLGKRCRKILKLNILPMKDVEITALCDINAENLEDTVKEVTKKRGQAPFSANDYKELLKRSDVDAVYICTDWEKHIEIAQESMRAGKYTAMEVGGAYSIEDCFNLVRTYEETGTHCMMLENCCYAQSEMLCLNMAKMGLFGTIVHCRGGYRHDLRKEILGAEYRLSNYMLRNSDNYPTHQLGPICKLLGVNNGNRMVSLVSVSSKACGLNEFAAREKGQDDILSSFKFAQGDIVTTIIKCAGGETVTLTLDTTLPRPYSRDFEICATRGCYTESNNSFFFDVYDEEYSDNWEQKWNNAAEYKKKYDHPLWKDCAFSSKEEKSIHMNNLVLRAFFESAAQNKYPPIDVYDAAAWSCISVLSEESAAMGGKPVAIPDFTAGKWMNTRKKDILEKYILQ